MKSTLVLGFAAVALFATPAIAAEFYIVQEPTTKRCTIVEQKPAGGASIVVGTGVFGARVEAENAMKTTKVCTDSTGSSTTTTTTTR